MKTVLFRLLCVPFLLSLALISPARAAMDHDMRVGHAAYTNRAFLSGMIAHHEAAVAMAKAFLNMPQSGETPRVAAWAKAVIASQDKEISAMQEWLKHMGGVDQTAYTAMQDSMRSMLQAGTGNAPASRFVTLMLPHHAEAVDMAVRALLYSDNPQVLELAKNIVMHQGDEMYEYKMWLIDKDQDAGEKRAASGPAAR